jgi:hypothetical protein
VGLRAQRAQFLGELRGIVETHTRLLDDLDAMAPAAK